jgi:hypothetical protein
VAGASGAGASHANGTEHIGDIGLALADEGFVAGDDATRADLDRGLRDEPPALRVLVFT